MSSDRETMTLEELQAFCKQLEAQGLKWASFRWGITEFALLQGAGRPIREINGSDTDSKFRQYTLPDGSTLWSVALLGPDDIEGIAWFSHYWTYAAPHVIDRGLRIEAWLDQNPDAYDLFIPIKWSAAPEEAKKAKAWMDENRRRLKASPLRSLYDALYGELVAAIQGGET